MSGFVSMSIEDRRYLTYMMIAKELLDNQPYTVSKEIKMEKKYGLKEGDIRKIWIELTKNKCSPNKMTFLDNCGFVMDLDTVFKCPLYEVIFFDARFDQDNTAKNAVVVTFFIRHLTERNIDFFAETNIPILMHW